MIKIIVKKTEKRYNIKLAINGESQIIKYSTDELKTYMDIINISKVLENAVVEIDQATADGIGIINDNWKITGGI